MIVEKKTASQFLNSRSKRSSPTEHEWVMKNSIKYECIIKNCQIHELFNQNWYFTTETRNSFLSEETYNSCYWGYNSAKAINTLTHHEDGHGVGQFGLHKQDYCWTCQKFPEKDSRLQAEIFQEFNLYKNYYWEVLNDISDRKFSQIMKIQNKVTTKVPTSLDSRGSSSKNNSSSSVTQRPTKNQRILVMKNLQNVVNTKLCATSNNRSVQARVLNTDIFRHDFPEVEVLSRPPNVNLEGLPLGVVRREFVHMVNVFTWILSIILVLYCWISNKSKIRKCCETCDI